MEDTIESREGLQEPAAMRRVQNHAQQSEFIPMPAGVKYLVCTEFLMHFSLRGILILLALFLFEHLRLSENASTELVHVFLTILGLSPIVGALLSDGYLGKYRTFLCVTLLQFAGNGILLLTTLPGVGNSGRSMLLSFTSLGLLVTAIGSGGLVPCITAFGGDQIDELIAKGAERDRLMRLFFSLYYVAMNIASFVSTVTIPAIRTLGTYVLIFSLQFGFAGAGVLIFLLGSRHYITRPVKENVFVNVFAIIGDAIRFRITKWGLPIVRGERERFLPENETLGDDRETSGTSEAKHHWLDGAKRNHDAAAVEDVKVLLRVLVLFTAMPVFWSLFHQQFSKWVFQARSLNCNVPWLGGRLVVQPDQMPALNPILVLIMIPIFNRFIYPLFAKLNIPLPPLRRMVIGMVLGALAFVISGALQLSIDKTLTTTSTRGSIGGKYNAFDVYLAPMARSKTLIDFQVASTPAKLSVFWQLPQYILITAGEVLLNITGLEFAYSQAPLSMKSVVQSAWKCTQAIGNLLTFAVVAIIGERVSKANEFFIFAGGCAAATFLLIWISHGYGDSSTIEPTHPDLVPVGTTTMTI